MGNNAGAVKSTISEAEEVRLAEAHRLIAECPDEELLQGLSRERELFSRSNSEVIKILIDELIRRKVYPEKPLPSGTRIQSTRWYQAGAPTGMSGRGPWNALIAKPT